MASKSLQEAQAQLNELLEAARNKAIIPVRLPGQIEEIIEAVNQAQAEQDEEITQLKNLPGGDVGAVILENAEFMKIAVHELRNPMTSIRGYADMLANAGMSGELTDMQEQLLGVVRSNARRMESLLSDISYINKLNAKILPVKEKMDLYKNIAMAAEKKARPFADELDRQLEFIVPDGLPILNVDGDHLAHAMSKLIENGLRYSPQGEGKVTVHAAGENGTLKITIEDNGVGMKPEEIDQLGTLFFRSDHEAVLAFKGSGLGIPIVYGLIDLIGGEISVDSAPDEGTRFTIAIKGMT